MPTRQGPRVERVASARVTGQQPLLRASSSSPCLPFSVVLALVQQAVQVRVLWRCDMLITHTPEDVEQRKQAVMNSIRQELAMSSVQELITVRI